MTDVPSLLRDVLTTLRSMTPETFSADRATMVAMLEALLVPPSQPEPEWVHANREFDRRRADARRALRRVKLMRERGLSDASFDLFVAGHRLTPTTREWAERIALLVQGSQVLTTAQVLDLLQTNHREHPDHVRVGRVLRALGWSRRRFGKGEQREYRYSAPMRDPGNVRADRTKSGEPSGPRSRV